MKQAARLLLISLGASAAATLLVQQGALHRVEISLSDLATFSRPVTPQNRTLLIAADEEEVRRTGKFPFDRSRLASALTNLESGGISRVYLDASLNYSEDAAGDDALEAAMARLGPDRLAVPRSRLSNRAGVSEMTAPLDRFARHATAVSTVFLFDSDQRVRRIAELDNPQLPLAIDWLAGRESRDRAEPLRINYALDPQHLRRVSLGDAAEGRLRPEDVRGRAAVIGLDVQAAQFRIAAPRHPQLSRLAFFGLAAGSLESGQQLAPVEREKSVALTVAIAAALALLMVRLSALPAFGVCLLFGAGWIANADHLQRALGFVLPVLAPPLAVLIVGQALKFRDSALARLVNRLWVRFVGVGKNSLVAAMDVMGEPALIYDASGNIVGMNEAFHGFRSDLPQQSRSGAKRIADLFPDIAGHLLSNVEDGRPKRVELVVAAVEGKVQHFDVSVRWVGTMSGRLAIASLKDITEARDRELSLSRLAFKDALTGLANRTSFIARLTRLREENTPFAVLLIDLDGFKQINDTLGHHAGDLLLSGVARRLEKLLRPHDLAARLGGDEFAIVLAATEQAGAERVATRLLQSLREPFNLEDSIACVGGSVGIALGPEHHEDPLEVLKLADTAMYAAKKVKPAYAVHRPDGAADVTKFAA
jgi:diguanylate cyclase (GGDEF)-like protein